MQLKYLVPTLLFALGACVSPKPSSPEAVMSATTDPLLPPEPPHHDRALPAARHLSSWPQHSPFCCITTGLHCNCEQSASNDDSLVESCDIVDPE